MSQSRIDGFINVSFILEDICCLEKKVKEKNQSLRIVFSHFKAVTPRGGGVGVGA